MPPTPPPPHTPRPAAEYRWTPRKAHAFLDALAQHGQVAAAARSVGMTRQSAYRLRDRIPVVAEAWPRAQALGRARRLDEQAGGRAGKATVPPAQGDTSDIAR